MTSSSRPVGCGGGFDFLHVLTVPISITIEAEGSASAEFNELLYILLDNS